MIGKRTPSRTCAGCRASNAREALLRFTLDDRGTLRLDYAGVAAGRGAWVCPRTTCVHRALERGGFRRSFRRAFQPPNADALHAQITATLASAMDAVMTAASRSGALTPHEGEGAAGLAVVWGVPPRSWAVKDKTWAARIASVKARQRDWVEGTSAPEGGRHRRRRKQEER